MFDFDELEVAKPFRASNEEDSLLPETVDGRKVLYSVQALLTADFEAVVAAVSDALLRGRPGEVDEETHARLFVAPPEYSEDFLKEFGHPPEKARLLVDEVANIHAAAFSMGLRPLLPGEALGQEGSAFHVKIRQLFLHSSQAMMETMKAWWTQFGAPFSCVQAIEVDRPEAKEGATRGSAPSTSFLVRVHSNVLAAEVAKARYLGYLQTADRHKEDHDGLIVYRCTIRARTMQEASCKTSTPRTEILHELLESPIYFVRSEGCKELDLCRKNMRLVCYMLEEEIRVWAAAHNFGFIEAWRRVHYDAVNQVLAVAKFIATVYNCAPGEGAAAAPERDVGVCFNMLYAKKLAARFRRKRYDGVHGGAPGGDQLDGGQFTDGSVSIRGFALLLDRVIRRAAPEADIMRRFVDLGAGRGNAVLAAHALFPFRDCVGIEILAEHVSYSRKHAEKYHDSEDFYMSAHRDVNPEELFIQGDFLTGIDWSDASVVFCNAVTWPRHLIREIALLALRLRPGAVFMLLGFGKFFPEDQEVLEGFRFRSDVCLVSWVDEPQGVWVFQRC